MVGVKGAVISQWTSPPWVSKATTRRVINCAATAEESCPEVDNVHIVVLCGHKERGWAQEKEDEKTVEVLVPAMKVMLSETDN